jgi:p-hydroxybenzoate 3-monooxygenase
VQEEIPDTCRVAAWRPDIAGVSRVAATDLVANHVDGGGDVRFEVRNVRLHDLETVCPAVTYEDEDGRPHRIDCDFVPGCDGARRVSRGYLAAAGRLFASHDYGIGWLALLAEAPPSAPGVIFGIHPRGFAAHMARTRRGSRW